MFGSSQIHATFGSGLTNINAIALSGAYGSTATWQGPGTQAAVAGRGGRF